MRGFYEEEILYRELAHYPPAMHMLAVLVLSEDDGKGETLAKELAEQAKVFAAGAPFQILGPTPASVGRVSDIFRNVLYAKCGEEHVLIALKDRLEAFLDKKEGRKEIVQFDFDPMNLY